jgi:hypothetical protein
MIAAGPGAGAGASTRMTEARESPGGAAQGSPGRRRAQPYATRPKARGLRHERPARAVGIKSQPAAALGSRHHPAPAEPRRGDRSTLLPACAQPASGTTTVFFRPLRSSDVHLHASIPRADRPGLPSGAPDGARSSESQPAASACFSTSPASECGLNKEVTEITEKRHPLSVSSVCSLFCSHSRRVGILGATGGLPARLIGPDEELRRRVGVGIFRHAECLRLTERLLGWTAEDEIPDRPNRIEPRRKKRRPKEYSLLSKPRGWYRLHGDPDAR